MSTAVLTALVIVLLLAVALLSVLVLGLLRSHALILRSLHDLGAGLDLEETAGTTSSSGGPGPVPVELEQGVIAPQRPDDARVETVRGLSMRGEQQSVDLTDGRHLLAFLTTGCHVCATFWEELRGPVEVPGGARMLVVAKGDDEESPSQLAKVAAGGPPLLRSTEAWDAQDIPGSPYFVYVDRGEIVGEGSATSWAQVSDLMGQAVADHEHRVAQGDVEGRGDRDDPVSVDAELLAAGIGPDHESLYPDPVEPDPETGHPRPDGAPDVTRTDASRARGDHPR